MTEWQPLRQRVGPDPRVKVDQGLRQPGQILLARLRREINVSGRRYRSLLSNCRMAPMTT